MTTIDEMDEFVNWDNTGTTASQSQAIRDPPIGAISPTLDLDPAHAGLTMDPSLENIDLAFENIEEDDFSFSALQFFTEDNPMMTGLDSLNPSAVPELPAASAANTDFWEIPPIPCSNCTLGGYSCKRIREGDCMGCCTSCVALSLDCSLGGIVPDNVNPTDPNIFFPGSHASIMENRPSALSFEDLANPGPGVGSSNRSSSVDLANLGPVDDTAAGQAQKPEQAPPKIGARFSRESVRILKNWLSTHNRHPYPSDEEKDMLQRKTGLNKTQITNWLANARRRGKVQPPRSTSPHPANWSSRTNSIDIPQRRATPSLEYMNPLQRWEHSPPEHEPASVTAIARAVTASSSGGSSGLNSPFSQNLTDDGSGRSICNQSSTSSLGTSQDSKDSSAYSHNSRNSWGSFGSAPFNSRSRRRRRRRTTTATKGTGNKTDLNAPLKTYQCTFCTETFRTKHDWQRHEKSLHLSLERWVCAPHGSRAVNPETNLLSCVFCGLANPDDAHIEGHNHSHCQDRSPEERTFYRKDHLNQHLRLVHNVKLLDWSMKSWKVATPEIRSRCGFCGIVMDTWTIRVDHLAEHFKTGYSMEDWKGDWGFDLPVLDMIENSIPPYLIHHERLSPLPYVASRAAPESPRNAYELIKLEMAYFDANQREQHGRQPTDEEMVVEGCRIIFASETLSLQGIATQASWFRDLIMASENLQHKARFGPLRRAAESRLSSLKINGKDNLFEKCPMEYQLQEFVRMKRLLGLTAMDDELQAEACRIVGRVEEVSTHPSENVSNWLIRLITSSTAWLTAFRRRAQLPRSEDVEDAIFRSKDPTSIDSTIHNYSRLERELADFLKMQRASGVEPSDEDLQRQARIIIYEFDDGWNQTAADNVSWLDAFRNRHPADGTSPPDPMMQRGQSKTWAVSESSASRDIGRSSTKFFLNDANFHRCLLRDLGRWVASTMSPNNPNQHVPTDAELRYQARWIVYDDDDQWNQTPADNDEWLERFKRNTGIIKDNGPGLSGLNTLPINKAITEIPPSRGMAMPLPTSMAVAPTCQIYAPIPSRADTFPVDSLLPKNMGGQETYQRPTAIFFSRELETGLVQVVRRGVAANGYVPRAETLRAYAKRILGRHPQDTRETPADDPELMGKFRSLMLESIPNAREWDDERSVQQRLKLDADAASFLNENISDEELGAMLRDMEVDVPLTEGQARMEYDGGVHLSGF